jgi:hypothetical protein
MSGCLCPSKVLPGWSEVKLRKFCYRVALEVKDDLRHKLLGASIAAVMEESLVPRYSCGRPLPSGLFCVRHKQDYDRLIFDRRPANVGEPRLSWAKLPYGSQLCRM